MTAFCLSIHAQYQCRHSGACCRTWSVPAEPHVIEVVNRHGLRPATANGPLFIQSRKPDREMATEVARNNNGSCVFFEQQDGLCAIHQRLGVTALPSSCRHFPRKFLLDSRGTFVSLSHFCPTAARLLLDPGPLGIVIASPPLILDEPVEGLDARDSLPPLLRPGVLCDPEGYEVWESAAIAVLARPELTVWSALGVIAAATERVRQWRPGDETLAACVLREFAGEPLRDRPTLISDDQLLSLLWRLTEDASAAASPAGSPEARVAANGKLAPFDLALKNFAAAHLFASWVAYQGRGLRTVVLWARAATALAHFHACRSNNRFDPLKPGANLIEAIRTADLLLRHGVDTQSFARAVAPLEAA